MGDTMKVTHKARIDVSSGCTLNELVDELNKLKGAGYSGEKVAFGVALGSGPSEYDVFWLEVGG